VDGIGAPNSSVASPLSSSSGGRVSGPIANQIIRALQQEGYLPGGDERSYAQVETEGAR
jgi:hypothetical protein